MTTFQTLTIIISFSTLAFSTIALYIKLKIDVAKIQTELTELRNLIFVNRSNVETVRKENRADHKLMFEKIDEVLKNTRR